jgi:hypothetical protein
MGLPSPTPLDKYREWFTRLPAELQRDLAMFIRHFSPRGIFVAGHDAIENPLPGFLDRLQRGEHNGSSTIGFTLFLRQITEWVYRSRATKDEWDRTRNNLTSATVAVKAELGPEYGSGVETTLEEMDFRSRMWVREYAGWITLRDGELSDTALLAWEHGAIGRTAAE